MAQLREASQRIADRIDEIIQGGIAGSDDGGGQAETLAASISSSDLKP